MTNPYIPGSNFDDFLREEGILEEVEAAAIKKISVRSAVARMQAAPHFFTQEEWNVLASYDGPVVSGDPEGHVPENLEADDNE